MFLSHLFGDAEARAISLLHATLFGMASTRRLETLQLNRKTRVHTKPKSFARCEHCVPAFFRVTAPLRAFDERDLSMAKANQVIDGFANAKGVVDGNTRAPYGRAVGANRHGGDSRRFVRSGIDQQQAFGAAVAESFNMPLEKR